MPLGSKATTLSHVKLVLGVVAMAAGVFCSESAHAENKTEPLSVHWDAPDSCPSEASLKQAVEAALGQPLKVARKQALSILASVSLGSAGYTATLRFQSPSGAEERTIDHPNCEKLMDATALVIALTIDPERVNAQQIKNQPESAATTQAPAPVSAVAVPPPAPSAPARLPEVPRSKSPETAGAPFHLPLSVFGLVSGGALPSVGPGIGVDLSAAREHFELGVVARYMLPRSKHVPGTESSDISVAWFVLELRACGLPWLGAWQLRLCVGGGGGDMYATGRGVSQARTRHTAVPSLSGGASLAYMHGAVSPFVGVGLDWLLVQPQYGVTQVSVITPVFTSGPIAVSGLLGLSYQL